MSDGARTPVIIDAVRTAIGRIGGTLAAVRADDLAGLVMDAVVSRAGIDKGDVDEVFFGCANQSGEDGRNVARMGLLLGGFPYEVPGSTINKLCASSLEAVIQAARAVQVGDGDVYIAGGVENMSRGPLVMEKGASPFARGNRTAYDTAIGWRFPNKKMEAIFPLENMGETAENLVELKGINREDQDAFALASQNKAVAAIENGWFEDEIVPVTIPQRKGEPIIFDRDEGPRAGLTMEKLGRLRPAFRKGGSVTA
ncbi:MAG: 3-oxoadipyl-CoA thiolase, partial [Deltaproteobacteria bacterium]|nr:3-oxoadipyl-CoA thiolase [Deltaproteobacteria bacterium]